VDPIECNNCTYLNEITGQIYSAMEVDTFVSNIYVEVTVSCANAAVAFDNPGIRGC
jgi:hypothetical protein